MYLNRITLIGFIGCDAEKKVRNETQPKDFTALVAASAAGWRDFRGG